jgi:hypothetical protein
MRARPSLNLDRSKKNYPAYGSSVNREFERAQTAGRQSDDLTPASMGGSVPCPRRRNPDCVFLAHGLDQSDAEQPEGQCEHQLANDEGGTMIQQKIQHHCDSNEDRHYETPE